MGSPVTFARAMTSGGAYLTLYQELVLLEVKATRTEREIQTLRTQLEQSELAQKRNQMAIASVRLIMDGLRAKPEAA